MRLDDRTWNARVLTRLQEGSDRLRDLSGRISSGRRLERPSDGPADYRRMLGLEARVRSLDVQASRFEEAAGTLDGMDALVGDLVDFVRRARTATQQGTNGTADAESRRALATEVDGLLRSAVLRANAETAGVYWLSGSRSNVRPFVTVGSGEIQSVSYQGDARFPSLGLPEGQRLDLQFTGDAVVAGGGEDMFAALIDLRNGLRDGSLTADPMLGRLEKVEHNLMERRVQAGAASKYLRDLASSAREQSLRTSEALSRVADTDLPEAVAALTHAEMLQSASFEVTARSLKMRLVDYLR